MGRAVFHFFRRSKLPVLVLVFLLPFAVIDPDRVSAQQPAPCGEETEAAPVGFACPPGIPLTHGSFQATPLMDGIGQPYPQVNGALHMEKVALYGQYGNLENNPTFPEAQAHFAKGQHQGALVQTLGVDGSFDPNGGIVALFIGFSNCEIEICGGSSDAWDTTNSPPHSRFAGQPCATGSTCPNLIYQQASIPWNTTVPFDGLVQQSLLWQAYSPANGGPLVGSHVYLFNGATGHQPLPNWDPFHNPQTTCVTNPECNYTAVKQLLQANGFSESQVQVVILYASTNYPECDLSGFHCASGITLPDAYSSEQYMGSIMRYLRQGYNGTVRYPNLRQVFIMSRNYGGYAQNALGDPTQGCLNPEPFSYEEGFAVQRLTVAQIKQAFGLTSNDSYSGPVTYDKAPWFDWGPYLWANGNNARSDGLFWCDNDGTAPCFGERDFRYGDEVNYFGDLTHPRLTGQQKAANQILNFLLNSPFTQHWIQQ